MAQLTTILTTLYILFSLPLVSAWTFVWRNASGIPTVEDGSGGRSCKEIDHAKGQPFEFDSEGDLVRLFTYAQTDCSRTSSGKFESYMLKNASSAILAYAVIDLAGANTTVEGELTPFPGADWFKSAPNSPIVTAMGQRLVDEGCGEYSEGPGAQWTESDRKSYECWQKKLGYSGKDADGWPGKGTWDQLKVPVADESEVGDSNSSSTATPSSTPTATNTPVPDTSSSSESSLSGGAIAGIVVGCVVGVGLISAILFLARRVKRRSTPEAGEDEQERQPEGDGDGDGGAVAVAVEESKRSSLEKLPAEAEAIPAKVQTKHFAELPGDLGSSELSETRRINELSDSQRVVEMGEK
ncbi:uncharacterized protein APUU_20019A [Aspergillus puulaauensis]|uniref:Uncharacterized protein n=1 Tax=Aspergillus puulaauensis TaxID=1220207 RepID=A0A7R8AIL5_9EURO|nr:uncharacterized protein APUU_20019A [Aspergillus puulaauensis]BCS19587.1 hypothetical protein APUU_20019A [Aspergillus puulaauensis]